MIGGDAWTCKLESIGQLWGIYVFIFFLGKIKLIGIGEKQWRLWRKTHDWILKFIWLCFTFQMLSMRNGLSLHPMCLPGVLQPMQLSQMRMGIGEENGSLHMNVTGTLPVNKDTIEYSLANQGTSSSHLSVPNLTDIINSETSFGLESSLQPHLGPFQLQTSSAVSFKVPYD